MYLKARSEKIANLGKGLGYKPFHMAFSWGGFFLHADPSFAVQGTSDGSGAKNRHLLPFLPFLLVGFSYSELESGM